MWALPSAKRGVLEKGAHSNWERRPLHEAGVGGCGEWGSGPAS